MGSASPLIQNPLVHLQIEYNEALIPEGGSEILRSVSPFHKTSKFEPAGHSFHEVALKVSGFCKEEETQEKKGEGEQAAGNVGAGVDSSFAWESGKSKKKGKDGEIEQDHYALIGLAHLRYLATEDQIRKAYRDAALKFHPDKLASALLDLKTPEAKEKRKEEIETKFKAVQKAYEILMDPVKRRNFDSLDEFDDSIPSDCSADDFFKVFGPVFQRNGRWSAIQPCLMPGDWTTPMEEVDKFYDFWFGFKSWREFPNEDEHDLETAESREHKRWMERQNGKLREKAKKEEVSRIRALVEAAYKRDPRILKRKEDEKKEKQRKKEAKIAAKKAAEEEEKKKEDEAKRQLEEEQKKAAEEAAVLRKQKEREKKLLRKERQRLRGLTGENISGAQVGKPKKVWGVSEDDIEELCQSLKKEQIQCLCEKLEEFQESMRRALTLRIWLKALEKCGGSFEENFPENYEEAEKKADEEFSEFLAKKDEFAEGNESSENGVLAANGTHSPAGNGKVNFENNAENREVKGENGVKEQGSGSKENGVKAQGSGKAKSPKAPSKPWEKAEIELLRKAFNKFPKGTHQRWEVISNYMKTGRTADEISRAVKTVLVQKPDDSKSYEKFLETRKAPKDIPSPLSTRNEAPSDSANQETPKPKVGGSERPQDSEVKGSSGKEGEGSGWSEVQERALIKAVKAFPKDTENRWERIATAIPGKSKAQCMKKYTSMKQNFRSSKETSSAST